jgi:hypothetical protein
MRITPGWTVPQEKPTLVEIAERTMRLQEDSDRPRPRRWGKQVMLVTFIAAIVAATILVWWDTHPTDLLRLLRR